MHRKTPLWLVGLTAALAALALSVAPAVADVSPSTVSETLAPGESITITKEVDVPEVPPKLDFVLDVDLSGSYLDDIANIKTLAPDLWDDVAAGVADLQGGLVTYVDYPYPGWGDSAFGDYAYQRDQDLTDDKTTWVNAINAMLTRYGATSPRVSTSRSTRRQPEPGAMSAIRGRRSVTSLPPAALPSARMRRR